VGELVQQAGREWGDLLPTRRVPTVDVGESGPGSFRCDSRLEPLWRQIIDRAFEVERSQPKVVAAVDYVAEMLPAAVRDADFSPFGGLHGSAAAIFCAFVEAVLSEIDEHPSETARRLPGALTSGLEQLDAFAAADRYRVVHVAPLIHLLPQPDVVRVAEGLTIRAVDDQRIGEIWEKAGVPADGSTIEMFSMRQRLLESTAQIELPVEFDAGTAYTNWAPAQQEVHRLAESLRFIGPGNVHHLAEWVEYPEHRLFLERISPTPLTTPSRAPVVRSQDLVVTEEAAAEVHRNLLAFAHLPEHEQHQFEVARRRFQNIYYRQSDEDRLIDAWIAFEALFLADLEGELKFRAQMRVAQYTGADKADKESIRETLKRSYDMRSKIVHGARASKRKPEAVAACATETVDILRRALRLWIAPDAERDMDAVERSMLP
jgi:hypothetical protein